jgi:WD40 repeat protein
LASGKLFNAMVNHEKTMGAAFHPDEKQVASYLNDKTVRAWTVCEWRDQSNHLFSGDIRRVVFFA